MDLLVIGYSNVFKNRILPLLNGLSFVDSVSIAKYSEQSWDETYKIIEKPLRLYDDYDSALNEFKDGLVYISTTNHSHYKWAKKSLNAGFHTIVDKPATMLLEETEDLIQIAKKKNLLLSESTVYLYHPQMKLIKNLFDNENMHPSFITVQFSFPPMNENNFRYNKELGGGALLDTSPYAASIGRYFFNESPLESFYIENSSVSDGVETSYSILLKYSNGRSLIGHFGFTTEYINRVNILSEKMYVEVDRVFTLPETIENTIRVKKSNQSLEVIAPSANMFENYFKQIEICYKNNDFEQLYSDMVMDAKTRDSIKK